MEKDIRLSGGCCWCSRVVTKWNQRRMDITVDYWSCRGYLGQFTLVCLAQGFNLSDSRSVIVDRRYVGSIPYRQGSCCVGSEGRLALDADRPSDRRVGECSLRNLVFEYVDDCRKTLVRAWINW